jgi:predicted nucleic-acid-binding protein
MVYLIDTNVFLRTLVKENKNSFNHCYSFLKAVKTNKIKAVTASIVLAEIVWTLSSFYKLPKKQVVEAIRSIVNLRGLKIVDKYNHLLAINLYESKTVKYIDAVIASIDEIQAKKWTVVSYDDDFDKLGIVRKEPKQVFLKNCKVYNKV